jgi:D-alanyl-D-alanine carboxypeptidase/D-alanyl-D-alanine-endopeptidase (penicillin-binding protein 4)
MARLTTALLLSLFLIACRSAPLAAGELEQRIEALVGASEYKGGRWGILVVDAHTTQPIYERNADMLFAPASVTKLYSCAAALIALGSDYCFETPVYRRGEVIDGQLNGDLILVGQGDFTLGGRTDAAGKMAFKNFDHTYANFLSTKSEVTATNPLAGLQELARQVKAAGIHKVDGEVLVDDRLFNRERGSGSGPDVISPIMVNDNVLDFVITPAVAVDELAAVEVRPRTEMFQVETQVRTVAAGGRPQIRVEEAGSHRLRLTGSIPVTSRPVVRIHPVPDPASFARGLFIEALRREGVAVSASPLRSPRATLPEPAKVCRLPRVAQFRSPPLAEALKVILKVSHNLYAGTLPLLLAVKNGKRSLGDGMQRQGRILDDLGVSVQAISLESGAGGGNGDRVTPRVTVQLLLALSRRPDFPVFRAALPVLGVDGTLVDVVDRRSPARGQVQAKTGTYVDSDLLNDRLYLRSKALAGVMTTRNGRPLVFAAFVNDVPLPKGIEPAREGKALGRLCEILHQYGPPETGTK